MVSLTSPHSGGTGNALSVTVTSASSTSGRVVKTFTRQQRNDRSDKPSGGQVDSLSITVKTPYDWSSITGPYNRIVTHCDKG